jgi:hypothetical protein
MELDKIEYILEKYFRGESTIAEEDELKHYFSSTNVAHHLKQYQPIFGYFVQTKQQKLMQEPSLQTKKQNMLWVSMAASVVVLLSAGIFYLVKPKKTVLPVGQSELGTYSDPEEALKATQKALDLVSNHVNLGIKSVLYVKEYEQSKNKIFKQ